MSLCKRRPAVFLDRDGTLNVEKNYLHRFDEWEWIDGAVDAIKMLNENGFLTIVVSNQAGIARGKYSEKDVELLHSLVAMDMNKKGGVIDDFYYCPHHPDFNSIQECWTRKPNPGMLSLAIEKWGIDFDRSWMIGDKLIDMQAGTAAGVDTILVLTGYGSRDVKYAEDEQNIATNLLHAVTEFVLEVD